MHWVPNFVLVTQLYMFRAAFLPETCRDALPKQNLELSAFVGFIEKDFITMHGHMNINFVYKKLCPT